MRAAAVVALAFLLAAAPPAAAQDVQETEDVLPPGHGRDAAFGYCTGCHSTAIIRRSGLSRERWDGLMDWMTEKHGMAPLEGELREEIVGYLAAAFPERRQGPRSARNPFLPD